MGYDFETLVSRKKQGSEKWDQMYEWNPNVSEDVVPLSVADMEFKNAPEIIEGLKEYLDEVILGYAGPYPEYHEAVISWMKRRHNYDIEKDWIVTTPGVVNAFYAAVNAFTKEDDGVIIFRPVYYPFTNAIYANNRKLVNCPLIKTDGYYTIDFDKFEELARDPKNKLLIFCNPHNPVGRVWTRDELEKVGNICLENDIVLVSDEIWNDLIMPGYKHIMMGSISEEIENITITCTAPSKTFNLAGLATSNIIVKNEEMRSVYLEALAAMRSRMVNILGYKACELAYTKSEKWLDELIPVIDRNQRMVKDFFDERHPEIKAYLSEGTYLQWVDFSGLGLSNEELEEFMHMEAQFFTDEGYIFGEEGNGYERINLAAPTWVIKRELERLDKALVKLKENK
ncbi:MalY/PatB family protein [Anaerosphaera multitolerans]|uniref:cysteine-S-conjugate beta-lyase n=1 Tax=Anaerosphaera multitolerans TaxID=2487351 RepID=A0A437SA01_9FIRM|nr:MalY/PatB family protein [Anaerosphaera multitolerans]RVU55711.1 pyridoxal phosphate-dependent aminotransferase [Anaerosphaera multitolerans]